MADINIDRLILIIEARTAQLERQLKKVEGQVSSSVTRMSKSFKGFESQILSAGKALASAFGITLGAGLITQIPRLFLDIASEAAKIGDVADRIGLTTERLQELQYGAVQADIEFDELAAGLDKFSKNVGEALTGAGDLAKVFALNGISLQDVSGRQKDVNQLLSDFATLVSNAKSEQEAMLLITMGMGRAGAPWLEFLKNGAKGLNDFGQAARDANAIIENESIRLAQRFDDAWARATLAVSQHFKGLAISIIDSMGRAGSAVVNMRGMFPDFMREIFGSGVSQSRSANSMGPGTYDWTRPPVTKLPNAGEEAAAKKAAAEALSARKKAAAEALREAEAIQRVIDNLQFEQAQLGRTALQQRIYSELKSAGVEITSEQGKVIARETEELYRLEQAQEAVKKATEKATEAAKEQAQRIQEHIDAIRDIGREAFVSLGQAFSDLKIKGSELDAILRQLYTRLIDFGATGAFNVLFGGPGQKFGSSLFGGLFGGGGASGGFLHFGGPRAAGGPVAPGRAYMVGERGPELFIPRAPGQIMAGGSRSGSVSIQVINPPGLPLAPARKRETVDAQGNRRIQLMLQQQVQREVPGVMEDVLPKRFGVSPVMAKRS